MRKFVRLFPLVITLVLILNGCGPSPSPTSTTPELADVPPSPTPAQKPKGKTILVNSPEDSGPGTLRQALQEASPGDIILFETTIFSPEDPEVIYLQSPLPAISQGNVTVDASNAGVILDGSKIPSGWNSGISAHSNNNTIRGLEVVGFSGAGIVIDSGHDNLIETNISCGNDYGIGLWGADVTGNVIKHNFLGIQEDGVTAQGNRTAGIIIMEGAHDNFIGPGNQIAFNGNTGIMINHTDTTGNLITQNSIYDHFEGGIDFGEGISNLLPPPHIFDFDLSAGIAAGSTCAGCIVEVFSDHGNEGAVFEGQAAADNRGVFIMQTGTPLTGPYLTATASQSGKNTSQFSSKTEGAQRLLILQTDNDHPRIELETKRSGELDDNRIGSVGMSDQADPFGRPHDLSQIMEQVVSMGLQQFRFTVVGIDGTLVDWSKPEFIFEQRQKDFLAGLAANRVKVTYLLIFRDDALGGEERSLRPRFHSEEEIQRYLDYVRFVISNVKGSVTYYEIWNEPNIKDSVQWIEADDYINLVRRVVPVIREEDPDAKIMLAGTTYFLEPESRAYTFKVLTSDIMPLVDAVTWHPMFAASPEFDSQYYYAYASIIQEIKNTASAHGFTGEYLAGEITWWTETESGADDWGIWYSDIAAAKYHARSIMMHLGLDVSVTNNSTPSAYQSRRYADDAITNLCTIMAGAKAKPLPVEVETEATNLRSYSFSLPNGDSLVAIWTDGVAVEDDPGVSATLILPNFSAEEVIGIDSLFGFEQQLIAGAEDGNLVVHNLLIKDYPIILHFKNSSSP